MVSLHEMRIKAILDNRFGMSYCSLTGEELVDLFHLINGPINTGFL